MAGRLKHYKLGKFGEDIPGLENFDDEGDEKRKTKPNKTKEEVTEGEKVETLEEGLARARREAEDSPVDQEKLAEMTTETILRELGLLEEGGEKEEVASVGVREVYRAGGKGEGMDERVLVVEEVMAREKEFMEERDNKENGSMSLALRGLAKDRHPETERLVLKLLESKVYTFRVTAVSTARIMKDPSDTIIARLEDMVAGDETVGLKRYAAEVLLQHRGSDALDLVIAAIHEHKLLHSSSAPVLERHLVALAKTEPSAFAVLKEVLEAGGERSALVLGKFWDAGDMRALHFTPGFRELSPEEVARIIRVFPFFILPEPGARVEYGNTRDLFDPSMYYIYLRAYWEDLREDRLEVWAPMVPPWDQNYIWQACEKVQRSFQCFVEGEWRRPDVVVEDEESDAPDNELPYPEVETLLVHIDWSDFLASQRDIPPP